MGSTTHRLHLRLEHRSRSLACLLLVIEGRGYDVGEVRWLPDRAAGPSLAVVHVHGAADGLVDLCERLATVPSVLSAEVDRPAALAVSA